MQQMKMVSITKFNAYLLSAMFCLITAVYSVHAQGQTTVTASTNAITVQQNQRVKISCITKSLFPNFMIWQKQTNKGIYKLATNAQLETAYSGLSNRYILTPSFADQTSVTFTLEITNSHLEDAGNYSCAVPQVTGAFANFAINVIGNPRQPIVTITDHSNNNVLSINNDDTLSVQQNVVYNLQCQVTGSNPAANVTISAGPWYHPGSSQVNITSHVERTAYSGLEKQTYTVLKTHSNIKFDLFVSPRFITCAAFVSAGNYTSNVQQVQFSVKFIDFAPIVSCQPSAISAAIHASSIYLKCNVTAPFDNKPDFWFLFTSKDGHNISLHVGDNSQKSPDGFYTADATYHDEIYVMSLAISDVQQWSFGTYNFTAITNNGQSSGYIVLSQTIQSTTKAPVVPAAAGSDKAGVSHVETSMSTITLLMLFLRLLM